MTVHSDGLFTADIGIDWANAKHDVCIPVRRESGARVRRLRTSHGHHRAMGALDVRALRRSDRGGQLAVLAQGKLKKKKAELKEALVGRMTPHYAYLLKQQLRVVDDLAKHIEALDARIEGCMHPFAEGPVRWSKACWVSHNVWHRLSSPRSAMAPCLLKNPGQHSRNAGISKLGTAHRAH